MKRIATIIMLFALMLSMLGGCVKVPKNLIPKPSASQSNDNEDKTTSDAEAADTNDAVVTENASSSDESDTPVSLTPAANPSEGYSNYMTFKSNAYDRVTAAAEKSDTLAITVSMSYLGVAMVDLSLLTLTMFTGDLQASEMAMGMLGMKDVKISGSGNEYTITYTDSEGASIKQTCTYDADKDQMASTLYDAEGKVSMFFEYVNLGDAYASQYYYTSGDGYEVIRSYFDNDNVAAFGTLTATDEPASILGKSSFNADFVKNDQGYLVLTDGKLTVFDKGTTTTN